MRLANLKCVFGKIVILVLAGILSTAGTFRVAAEDLAGEALSAAVIWTGQPDADQGQGSCVVFRKQFQLSNMDQPVTMQAFADARYVLWVNGHYVQRGPARFEPKAPEYDSVDITKYLRSGNNVVAVLVTARISNGKVRMHTPGFTARVVQAEADGPQMICATDTSWKWSDEIRYRRVRADWPNIYDIVDERVEDGDWTQLDYNDSHWGAAQPVADTLGDLTARRIPLLRETVVKPAWPAGTTWPVSLKASEQITFKFPRLVLAYVDLQFSADDGSELELTYSPQTQITCRAGEQSYISTDTHSIFEGGIRVKSGRVTLERIKFVERLYPFDQVGTFESIDPLLNRLWKTCIRGHEITSEDGYVDCADRERVEWMDCDPPAFDVTRVAMAGPTADGGEIYADPRLLEELVRRTAYTLQPGGWVKAHTCSDRFDIHAKMEDRACDWMEGARRYYESCGQTNVIREIWPAVVSQMNYFLDRRTPRGLVLAREWVVWGDPVGYQTCEGTALNAFIYRALVDAAFLGNVIGEKDQAAEFSQAANGLAKAINTVLWDEAAGTYYAGYYDLAVAKAAPDYRPLRLSVENHLIEPTLHAALFTLDQGVVPETRHASVTQYMMAHAPTSNDIMQYYYFFKQQYAADDPRQDLAVLNKLRTDWADMANSPYDAGFEGLHSWGSRAHCYGIYPAYFLSSYVLGVRLDGPAQKKSLLIEPRLGNLKEASGNVVTEFGPVFVSWKQKDDRWYYVANTSKLQADITVHLHLPVGIGIFSAMLDDVVLESNTQNAKRQGRWLEVPLTLGVNQGFWKCQS